MTGRFFFLTILCFVLGGCGPSPLPASEIESVSDYADGVAIATTKDGHNYFVDDKLVPVNKTGFEAISDFTDGFALALSSTVQGNCTSRFTNIVNRHGEIIETFDMNAAPVIVPGGCAWVPSGSRVALKDLANGTILIEEPGWLNTVSAIGTAVLARARSDKHPDGSEYADLVEFMLVDRHGRILVPWGRIGYIGELSNGRAVASNSAQGGLRGLRESIGIFSRSSIYDPTFGYIDEQGNWAIPEKFYSAEDFNQAGYAKVLLKPKRYFNINQTSYIDKSGRVLQDDERDTAMRSFRKDPQ